MTAIALSLCAIVAVSAPAAMAQVQPLTAKQAKKLARDLGQKQKRDNRVIVFHVEDGQRVDSYTYKFHYDERTGFKQFCTAVLRVHRRQVGNTIETTARLTRHRCKTIPADVLRIERATRQADRRVRRNETATLRSVTPILRALETCKVLRRIPKSRLKAADAVITSSINRALIDPNDGAVAAYVNALNQVGGSNDVLIRAIEGWTDTYDVLRSYGEFPKPCRTLRTWENANWTAAASPIDMPTYVALTRRGVADGKAIARGARHLLAAGAYRKLVLAFTPEGLLTRYIGD
jgi:hypothetical protein